MIILNPYRRIELIAQDRFPSICHDYSEGIWDFEESKHLLSHYREVGVSLAQRFDDNVDVLGLLNEAYAVSADCLEDMRMIKEMEQRSD